jgi:hypothetical protein
MMLAGHKSLNRPPTYYALSVDIGVWVYDLLKLWGDAPSSRTIKGDPDKHRVAGQRPRKAIPAIQTAPRAAGSLL